MKKTFKIDIYTKVEDKKPKIYEEREDAEIERRNLANLQPENIYIIDEIYE